MRRSEMNIKLQRLYYIRHCLVESMHLSVKDFIDEILACVEDAGMLPPETLTTTYVNEWEPEQAALDRKDLK